MELWMIVLLVLVGVILVFFLVASGIRFYANSITTWFNIRKMRFEGTISDHTRALLDMNGLADVQVRTTGFFSSMFVGNTYKVSTKTVRLSWLTSRRATPTNLAIACKLVALAKLHRENVSGLGSVAVNRWTSGLPILFLPLIVVGLIIDLISSGGIGIERIDGVQHPAVLPVFPTAEIQFQRRKHLSRQIEAAGVILQFHAIKHLIHDLIP